MSITEELTGRAEAYAKQSGLRLGDPLGHGVHGIVFATESQPETRPVVQSAIKALRREPDYQRERDVYRHLRELEITQVRGCHVPELLQYDDTLLIIEMTIVTRPFVLDFAGAYLDFPPEFSDEVMADWHAEKRDQFGSRWGEVQAILRELEGLGIYMIDVNPGNISFG